MDYPITAAVRFLRENNVEFKPFVFEYVEKGGTKHSAKVAGVDEHNVIKTLIFETNEKKPLMVLMHGNLQISAKSLARHLNVKSVEPVSPEKASKLTGYMIGGTSPFGVRTEMPVYVEKSIFDLMEIYINGGKRGFLVQISTDALKDVLKAEMVEVGI